MSDLDQVTHETDEQRNERVGRKCAEHAQQVVNDLMDVLDKHKVGIDKDKEISSDQLLIIFLGATSACATSVVMYQAEYLQKVEELMGRRNQGDALYLLAALSDFELKMREGLIDKLQQKAVQKIQKPSLVGV